MKIALAQSNILWENTEDNLIKAQDFIKDAAENQCSLICFPEMSFSGFSMEPEKCSKSNSLIFSTINSLSIKYHINIGYGYITYDANEKKGYNNYKIVSKSGNELINYVKIHPFSFGMEGKYYNGGNDINFTNIDDISICPFICYDLRFPEIFQYAAGKCDLITVAANWPEKRKHHWLTLLKARAIENQCYIAGINRVGTGNKLVYSGNSVIIDPLGNVISSIPENTEGMVVADIDKNQVKDLRKTFPRIQDRRLDLYKKLYE